MLFDYLQFKTFTMENSNSKIGVIFLLGLLVVVLLFLYLNTQNKKVVSLPQGISRQCYDLPTSLDSSVFGPKYWQAFQSLAHNVPCYHCRVFAEKFISYFHDIVNIKTGKQPYDINNYNYFNKSIANLNSGQDFNTAFGIIS